MGRIFGGFLIVFLVLCLIVGGVFAWGYGKYAKPGPLEAPVTVIVPRGASVAQIAELLAERGVISNARIFTIGVRLTGVAAALEAGEYLFPTHASPREVAMILQSGDTVVRRLTIPEGLTSAQVAHILKATDGLDGTLSAVPPEGAVLPETYHFSYGDKRIGLLQRMERARRKLLDELWQTRQPDLPLKTPEQALILASIVEKETAIPEERPRIAAVFLNRLKRGMRLQSDPTVAYGLEAAGHPLGRPLTRADLKSKTPYNTYVIKGLPPTPICNPGRASIAAVLNPAQTDDLYFVADGTGGHVFSRTLAEHNRNVARWRKIEEDQAN